MSGRNLFYHYYDELYLSKNYAEEAAAVMSMVKKFYLKQPDKMLEIGAGTGNHTVEFARQNITVTALDTDKEMICIAQKKIAHLFPWVKLLNMGVEKIENTDFDFAVAGFNVVNYIPELKALDIFFKSVNNALKPDGLFIFDCWNGAAAIMDPPKSKSISIKKNDLSVQCNISSETDFLKQKTILNYYLIVRDKEGRIVDEGIFSFDQMLWTPLELEHFIRNAGFEILSFCHPFQPDKKATERDWKVMFVCRKK